MDLPLDLRTTFSKNVFWGATSPLRPPAMPTSCCSGRHGRAPAAHAADRCSRGMGERAWNRQGREGGRGRERGRERGGRERERREREGEREGRERERGGDREGERERERGKERRDREGEGEKICTWRRHETGCKNGKLGVMSLSCSSWIFLTRCRSKGEGSAGSEVSAGMEPRSERRGSF